MTSSAVYAKCPHQKKSFIRKSAKIPAVWNVKSLFEAGGVAAEPRLGDSMSTRDLVRVLRTP